MTVITEHPKLRLWIGALAAAWTCIMAILPQWDGSVGLPAFDWALASLITAYVLASTVKLSPNVDAMRHGIGLALAAAALTLAWFHGPSYGEPEIRLLGYGILCLPWLFFAIAHFRVHRGVLIAGAILSTAVVTWFVALMIFFGFAS